MLCRLFRILVVSASSAKRRAELRLLVFLSCWDSQVLSLGEPGFDSSSTDSEASVFLNRRLTGFKSCNSKLVLLFLTSGDSGNFRLGSISGKIVSTVRPRLTPLVLIEPLLILNGFTSEWRTVWPAFLPSSDFLEKLSPWTVFNFCWYMLRATYCDSVVFWSNLLLSEPLRL